jgi:hypothetical protein
MIPRMLTFLAAGDWARGQIHATWGASSRRIVPKVEQAIDAAWREALLRPGVKLFDGPMCRLGSWDASPDSLRLMLSETSYKPFFGTNLSHPELADRFGRDVMANPVGVSPALHTADGFLLLGRRNSSVAYYPNRIHPFAGALEPRDDGDMLAAVRRELREELSLADEDIFDVRCTGIAEDRALRQPELLFRADTRLTKAQLEAQVHADEHHHSLAIPATREAVEQIIRNPELTPVAVASLMLWGRVRFGNDWYRGTASLSPEVKARYTRG